MKIVKHVMKDQKRIITLVYYVKMIIFMIMEIVNQFVQMASIPKILLINVHAQVMLLAKFVRRKVKYIIYVIVAITREDIILKKMIQVI